MVGQSNDLIFNIIPGQHVGLELYLQNGGYEGLKKAFSLSTNAGINQIKQSRLRGRGGAAFPTGDKIEMVKNACGTQKYIVCNADEGEPGTFKDRFIMTCIPFQLIEGITIAAFLTGAQKAYIYVRHEYPEAQAIISKSIDEAQKAGLLGQNIMDSGFSFSVELFSGAGSYLCGEETALLSSVEGRKGRPRLKPPYPTSSGLFGLPTLVQNVETLANLPKIMKYGPSWFKSIGTVDSAGTKLVSLSGDVNHRGIFEVPYGVTFAQIIQQYGEGIKNGKRLKAVNIGGASGVLVPPFMLNVPLEYLACEKAGITIGSGAIFVLDESRSIIENVQNRVRFFLQESCGKCTPCREGLWQVNALLKRFGIGKAEAADIQILRQYINALQGASFCGLGIAAGNTLKSSLAYYLAEYESCCIKKLKVEEVM